MHSEGLQEFNNFYGYCHKGSKIGIYYFIIGMCLIRRNYEKSMGFCFLLV